MDKKQLTEMAKNLLEKAQKDPELFANLTKDDMPHPANSPEDKAHDVKEEDESLQQALALLDTPEKRSAMLEHLRSLQEPEDMRSPENQAAGQDMDKSEKLKKWFGYEGLLPKDDKDVNPKKKKNQKIKKDPNSKPNEAQKPVEEKKMDKSEKSALEMAKELLKAAQENPEQFEEVKKNMAPAPAPKAPMAPPKMAMPKPPKMQAPGMAKEEMEKGQKKSGEMAGSGYAFGERGVNKPKYGNKAGTSEAGDSLRFANLNEALGQKKEAQAEKNKAKSHHKETIKDIKRMPKPNLPKSEDAMAKEEMEKCGPAKMSKAEIKEDLKKEWKPKFKKECK